MKDWLKIIGSILVAITVLTAIGFYTGFLGRGANLAIDSVFNVKEANLERKVFKESKSYNEGAANDLQKYYEQYNSATTPQDKEAIREYVLMGYSNYDESKLESSTLRRFLVNMRENNTNQSFK